MSNKVFISILVVLALIFGGLAVSNKNKAGQSSSDSSVQPTKHLIGSNKNNIVLTEYGDFQCPACLQYYPLFKQLKETYKDRVEFQFSNFPLVQIHKNAFLAARAAEAADKQGKFWEMHDLLYEGQKTWAESSNPVNIFLGYAAQLSLDSTRFQSDMTSQEVNDLINADIKSAQKLGATSTPTFALNGKKIENPTSLEEFNKVLDDAIAASKKTN